jgi:hypothetical protein
LKAIGTDLQVDDLTFAGWVARRLGPKTYPTVFVSNPGGATAYPFGVEQYLFSNAVAWLRLATRRTTRTPLRTRSSNRRGKYNSRRGDFASTRGC